MAKTNDEIKAFIKTKMIEELTSFLTIGREDNDVKKYSKKQVSKFLNKNDETLNTAVDNYYALSIEDGSINDIESDPDGAYREVLYEHFDTEDLLK